MTVVAGIAAAILIAGGAALIAARLLAPPHPTADTPTRARIVYGSIVLALGAAVAIAGILAAAFLPARAIPGAFMVEAGGVVLVNLGIETLKPPRSKP